MPNALSAVQTNLENSVVRPRLGPGIEKLSFMYVIVLQDQKIKHVTLVNIFCLPECDRELIDFLNDEFVVVNNDTFT